MANLGTLIEYRDAAGLTAYARNARTHSADQVADLAASMREWGWTMPVLVAEGCDGAADGEIIAGHGRVLAAAAIYVGGGTIRMAGGDAIPAGQVPVIAARGWSVAQRRAYVIADNQLTLAGGWDESILQLELLDLRDVGFDLSKIGFEDSELAGLLDVRLDPEVDPEDAPEPPVVPVSRSGDVWLLGRHRLLCGDATSAEDVARVLGGARPHLMVTDPPYGAEYDADWRNRADRANGKPYGDRAIGTVNNDDRADWRQAWALFPGDVVYAWSPSGDLLVEHHNALIAAGFEIRMQIIWAKQQFAIGRGHYHIDKPVKSETGHGTQKPVECMRRPIENNSKPGDAVYDPFVGSGTTIIAAEMTGRRCLALEINPAYVDVSVLRWQNRHRAAGDA
jgi:DNA modification methylase